MTTNLWMDRNGMHLDRWVFTFLGCLFLGTAALLTIQELDVGPGFALAGLGAATALVAVFARSRWTRLAGFLAAQLACAGSLLLVVMNLGQVGFELLVAPVAGLAVSVWQLRRRESDEPVAGWQTRLTWFSFLASLVITSWLAYTLFLSQGLLANFPPRRMVLTAFWGICGVSLYLGGRIRRLTPMLKAGATLIALAVGKTWLYDVDHLDGFVRITAVLVMGLLLFLSAAFLHRNLPPDEESSADGSQAAAEPTVPGA